MRTRLAVLLALLLTSVTAVQGAAQASPYVPLDDPMLPQVEWLIARGVIADPSPFIRPFRRSDLLRVLREADTASASTVSEQLRAVLARYERDDGAAGTDRYLVEGRIGGQAYTDARRDVLQPAGPRGVRPYADLRLEGQFGPVTLVSRPAVEPRLVRDPDWQGRRELSVAGRMVDAYAAVSFKPGTIYLGQLDWNWGPLNELGLGLSNAGYSRTGFGFDLGGRTVRLQAQAMDLREQRDSLSGERISRFYFAHRLVVTPSSRLTLALWETALIAGENRLFDARFRNPLSLLVLANQYGAGDTESNVAIGADVQWRANRRLTLQAQLMLDDLQYERRSSPTRYPDRYGVVGTAFGPLGRTLAWQFSVAQLSSLAYRTTDAQQNLVDGTTGLGRSFADNRQLSLRVDVPLRRTWLLRPEVTFLQQGEGQLSRPFPQSPEEAGLLPQLFIGTVERTLRLGMGFTGREGPLDLQGTLGVNDVRNAGNLAGRNKRQFVGRVQAALRFGKTGAL